MPRTIIPALALLACNGPDKLPDDSAPAHDDSGVVDDTGDPPFPDEAWDWCPDEAPAGDASWTRQVRVTEGALYCGMADEGRTLLQEIEAKAQLRLMPGALPLPGEDAQGVASLPACVMLDEGQQGLVSAGEAALEIAWNTYGEDTYYQARIRQPMQDAEGQPWTLSLFLTGLDTGSIPDIDGGHLPTFGDHGLEAWVCQGEGCEGYDASFRSCTFDGVDTDRHSFSFDGGALELDVRIGESFASTEPSAFVAARGELSGQAFTQTDYWRLIYNPEHHHFSRDAIVFFDEPIDAACGLSVLDFDAWGEPPETELHLVDCDGVAIEQRTITEERFELVP
ncbi:MAG: hypothetical protein H6741_19305 [Alphaproteobacteria bacterium]|nr:hypothetical protein [Alphaproteobacteria bacterium]